MADADIISSAVCNQKLLSRRCCLPLVNSWDAHPAAASPLEQGAMHMWQSEVHSPLSQVRVSLWINNGWRAHLTPGAGPLQRRAPCQSGSGRWKGRGAGARQTGGVPLAQTLHAAHHWLKSRAQVLVMRSGSASCWSACPRMDM